MKNKIVDLISDNIEGLTKEEIFGLMETPPKPEMGDFAFPCFRLAKTMRKAPQMIASDIKEAIGTVDFLEDIQVQGAYLNFFVDKSIFVKSMILVHHISEMTKQSALITPLLTLPRTFT